MKPQVADYPMQSVSFPDAVISHGSSAPEKPNRRVKRVQQAQAIMAQQLWHTPMLSDLAAAVCTCSRTLSADFQALHQQPVIAWLREQRLQEIARLLKDTELPLEVIATQTGYTSAANLCTAFKRRFACTPGQYRRQASAMQCNLRRRKAYAS